jgi:hypothetical protein
MKRLWLTTLLLCIAGAARAQVDRAQLSGTVKDPQGAAIPGAAISIAHSASAVVTRVKTTGSGVYLAASLPPGRHVVEAEARAFRSARRPYSSRSGSERASTSRSASGGSPSR